MGYFALALLCEEIGRTVAPVPVVPTLVSTASTLQRFAGPALQERWLPGIAGGELLLSAALEEYQAATELVPGDTGLQLAMAALFAAGDERRSKVGARGIDCGRVARGSRTENQQLTVFDFAHVNVSGRAQYLEAAYTSKSL